MVSSMNAVRAERASAQSQAAESLVPSEPNASARSWSGSTKVGFRFAFSYLCLYLYPPSATLGWFLWFLVPSGWEEYQHDSPWRQLVPWIAAHLLHLKHAIAIGPTHEGAYDHLKVLCFLLISAIVTCVWSVLDRKRAEYSKLYLGIRTYARVVLGLTMIGFGTFKVIPVQAPPPDLFTLMQPFGDFGMNRIFWTTLGLSPEYMVFAGCVETLGGVLLLIPGLTTLGALVSLAALGAVFTQSAAHNVPVKLGVLHLILIAVFLLLPDVRRLLNVLVFNRATEVKPRPPLFQTRWLDYSIWGLQWGIAAYVIVKMLFMDVGMMRGRAEVPARTPLYGIWKVEEFTIDNQVHPPILTDDLRWQRVIFESNISRAPKMFTRVQEMDGELSPGYIVTLDSTQGTLSLKSPSSDDLMQFGDIVEMDESGEKEAGHDHLLPAPTFLEGLDFFRPHIGSLEILQLKYNRLSPDAFTLEGPMKGHQVHMLLKKEDRHFVLQERRFRWIIEGKDVQ